MQERVIRNWKTSVIGIGFIALASYLVIAERASVMEAMPLFLMGLCGLGIKDSFIRKSDNQ